MASDNTIDSIKLGFVDSPTSGDDYIDLHRTQANRDNPSGYVGFTLHPGGFAMGPVEDHPDFGPVRTLTITLSLEGTSKDDVTARLRNLNRFIRRSNLYFEGAGGNPSSRSDGKWHDGEATVLTFKPAGASYEVYWDVVSGTPPQLGDLLSMQNKSLEGITFSLVVRAAARLTRVRLCNLVAMGDAAEPFNVTSGNYGGNFTAGWVFSSYLDWALRSDVSGYPAAKYGVKTLMANGGSPATFTTNEAPVSTGDVVIPDIWFTTKPIPTGTTTAKLQTYNGTSWVDQQTFLNLSSYTDVRSTSYTNPNWTRFSGTAYTVASGITKVRLSVSTTIGSDAAFDGLAIWKNPVGNIVPTTEYITGGMTAGIPVFNVYGIRGDIKTPIKLRVDNPSASQVERFFIVGGITQDLGIPTTISNFNSLEKPIMGLDFRVQQTATAATNLPWGTLPADSSGGIASTSYLSDNAPFYDRRQRIYRAFLVYAANDKALITAVKITIPLTSTANAESKTFNAALPQTYTGNTTPTASQYKMYELGDFQFSRPGVAWEELSPQRSGSLSFLTLYHSTDANRHTSVAGLILLPTKPGEIMAASLDIGTVGTTKPLSAEIYSEGRAPRVALQLGLVNWPVELNSYDATGVFKGTPLWVMPYEATSPTMAMRFEILMLRSRDETTKLYTFDATDPKQVSLEYTPRYLYGMAS